MPLFLAAWEVGRSVGSASSEEILSEGGDRELRVSGGNLLIELGDDHSSHTSHIALAQLGVTAAVPSESTIRRCLQRLAPDQLDELIWCVDVVATEDITARKPRI